MAYPITSDGIVIASTSTGGAEKALTIPSRDQLPKMARTARLFEETGIE
jgi:hypothetical protein